MQTTYSATRFHTLAGRMLAILTTLEAIDSLRNQSAPAYVIPANIAWTEARSIAIERMPITGHMPQAFILT